MTRTQDEFRLFIEEINIRTAMALLEEERQSALKVLSSWRKGSLPKTTMSTINSYMSRKRDLEARLDNLKSI